MIEYRYRDGFKAPVPAQVLGACLEGLRTRHVTDDEPDGSITPAEVVEHARDPGSEIHRCFTWDRDEAAHKYNLVQARYLIRCYDVRVVVANAEPIVYSPGCVQVTRPDGNRCYVSSVTAMNNAEYRDQVLNDTSKQLEGMKERLRNLTALSPEVIRTINRLKVLLEKQARARKKAQPVARA